MIRKLPPVAALVLATSLLAQTTKPSTAGTIAPSANDAVPLQKGDKLPALTLKTIDNQPFDLAAAAKKPTVLIFYRGGWCPFCNAQLAGLQKIEKELTAAGYQLLAISPDKPEELAKTRDKHSLSYTLLSDSDAAAIKAFGLAFKLDDPTFNTYRTSYKIDLEQYSGQTHHALPVPAVYILNTDGTIHAAHYNPDYKVRPDPAQILAEAKAALNR